MIEPEYKVPLSWKDPNTGHTLVGDYKKNGWAEVWILNANEGEKIKDYARHLRTYKERPIQL